MLSCGGLGFGSATAELQKEGNYVVGVDARDEQHGKYLTDHFYLVPRYSGETQQDYIKAIAKIVEKEKIDYIMGGHTKELIILQEAGFDNVLSSSPKSLRLITDKFEAYKKFSDISPGFYKVETPNELYACAEKMGYPDNKLCIKPCVGSGGRGFRILAEDYDKTKWTFEDKSNPYMTIDELAQLTFPPLLLMEYLEGPQYHLDILAYKGEPKKIVVSYRLEERFGFGFSLECEDRPEYEQIAKRIVKELDLSYNCFVQLKAGKLIEIGGRMQGSVPIGLDLAVGAVKLAKGEEPNIRIRKVRMIRAWKEIFYDMETGEIF